LIDLIKTNGDQKDGPSMCKAFAAMIDKAEKDYDLIVVCFCCDNDGSSQAGRKQLVIKWPWLFVAPCCAHQVSISLHSSDK
jgi:hypothetical protein